MCELEWSLSAELAKVLCKWVNRLINIFINLLEELVILGEICADNIPVSAVCAKIEAENISKKFGQFLIQVGNLIHVSHIVFLCH